MEGGGDNQIAVHPMEWRNYGLGLPFFFLGDCIALIFLSFWMGLWVKGYTCCISYIACCFSIFFLTFRGNMKIMVQSICLWCFSTNNREGDSVGKEW